MIRLTTFLLSFIFSLTVMGHKTKRVKWNGSVDGESLLISVG